MKRDMMLAVAALGLAVVFSVTCVLVWLSRGHHRCLAWKLKVGAMLILVNGFAAGACQPMVTCYFRADDDDWADDDSAADDDDSADDDDTADDDTADDDDSAAID